ncbi:rhomboid-like protein [Mycobacterium sp. Dal123C01]|uniref:rhomboid-like protein n=1 Tax=Mycobacterium sp. Dal123C01 TaxID=3457577 RepID=UPI00403E7825
MADASMRSRLPTIAVVVQRFIKTAWLTYSWLFVLLITTIVQDELTGPQRHWLLLRHSTNIYHLGMDPLDALVSSLLWIDGKNLAPYLVLFTLFLAPAERWLGELRWLTVGLSAHVLATFVSEGIVFFAIEEYQAPERLVNARDIGVSYFLVGVAAVLTYHIAVPWRWGYLGVLLLVFGIPLITMNHTVLNFTAIGHFSAILVGLCFYPATRNRPGRPLNPATLVGAIRRHR